MLKYEFWKIFHNKPLLISLCVLLIANCLLIYFNYKDDVVIPDEMVENVIDTYIIEPDTLQVYYDEILAFQKEQSEIKHEHDKNNIKNYVPLTIQNKYSTSDEISDLVLLNELFIRVEYITQYRSDIMSVIKAAQKYIEDYDNSGISSKSYAYKYQLELIERYEYISENVTLGLEYTRGWKDFFTYQSVDVFIIFAIIILAATILNNEYNMGTLNLLRSAKYGRFETIASKLICFTICLVVIVFLFLGSTFIMYGAKYGYSSIYNSLQVIDDFKLCPYNLSILEFLVVYVFIKTLSILFFGSIILFVSSMTHSMVITYISGIGLFGINYLLNTFRYDDPNHILKYANLLNTASVTGLYTKYKSIDFFQQIVEFPVFIVCLFIIISIIAFIIITYIYCRRNINHSQTLSCSIIKKKHPIHKFSCFLNSYHKVYGLSLSTYEGYKLLVGTKYIILIVILLLVKLYSLQNTYILPTTYVDRVYHEYMIALAGEMNDDKSAYLLAEREKINTAFSMEPVMREQYSNGEISFEEYSDFLKKYNYAYNRNAVFTQIEEHAEYIEQVTNLNDTAWFVYDTGWKALFSSGFDWTLYVIVLLLFSGIYGIEYSGTSSSGYFVSILRTTKNGRTRTYLSKFTTATITSCIMSVIWFVVDIVYCVNIYDMPLKSAPLKSIQTMENFLIDISIVQYLIIYCIIRVLSVIVLTIITVSLSALLHKNIAVLSIVTATTLVPYILSDFGVAIFKKYNFISYMCVTPVLLNDYAFFYYTGILLIICGSLTLCSKKRWCL